MEPAPPLLTIREVADYTRIPIATLRYLRTQGRGPRGFRVGRHLRYRVTDLEDWIKKCERDG